MTELKSKYFTEKERGCQCGNCGRSQGMKQEIVDMFDDLREMCGFPLRMTSGFRCPLHSKNPGGSHGAGEAGDIGVSRSEAYFVLKYAFILGFTGIGVKQHGDGRFIHLDKSSNVKALRPTIFSYK